MEATLTAAPKWVMGLLDVPLKILIIALVAVIVRMLAHRFIGRIAEGIAAGQAGLSRLDERLPTATALLTSPLISARRMQRARTTATILKSATTAAVAVVAILTVLPLVGIPNTTLITSAGVIGVALGIGAQTVVKDLLSGIFILVEDQYGVGDVVDVGEVTGAVESVGLRVTRLRGSDGTVWYVRNGEIVRVGNRSQGWARAVLDVGLPKGLDVTRAQDLLLDVAQGLAKDETLAGLLIGEPQVWGIEALTTDGVALRLVVKTQPLQQWTVVRELRRRILERFAAEGLPRPTGLDVPANAPGAD